MTALNLHFLDARNNLAQDKDCIRECLSETYAKAKNAMSIGSVDVVIKAGSQVIPEKGHLGYTPEAGVIYLTIDPHSLTFRANKDASLQRMFAHELHHLARWDGPGYGSSLGEALISEGLAGHFVIEIFGGRPELWENLSDHLIRGYANDAEKYWESKDYNHNAWFFGTSIIPKWTGYSLGYAIIKQFLLRNPDQKASSLAKEEAAIFRRYLNVNHQ